MADEKVTATEEVADAELSKAYDAVKGVAGAEVPEVVEEVKTETETETEEKPPIEKPASAETEVEEDEKLDHKEESRLGRKVKGLNDRFDQILARLDQLAKPAVPEQKIEIPDVITTSEDVDKVLDAREQKKVQAKQAYESDYLKQVQGLAQDPDNEELHDEIWAEMLTPKFNVIHSQQGMTDARINYAEAKAHVLKKRMETGKPKVAARDTAERPPIQPAASATRTATKVIGLPKLDEHAQSFVAHLRRQGMSDEDIAKELAP